MTTYKVVVDGSNIATEGRSLPSLNQLDEAVQSFVEEHPGAEILVIVDTSFAHRVDPSESQVFESAYEAGEIIMPPAGTIGRGDSFILKVADKLGATVFSNDSFQEFHGTYDWLFDRGRLIGGKPVPGLGWVFMDRTPVRGPKSREAVREAKRSQVRIGSKEAMRPMPVPKAPPAFAAKKVASATKAVAVKSPGSQHANRSSVAIIDPEQETISSGSGRDGARRGRRDRRRGKGRDQVSTQAPITDDSPETLSENSRRPEFVRKPGEPINEPLAFISFVAEHGIGTLVEGEIESYSSHGFYVTVAGARGYSPLHGLAEPMPRSAKEVVRRGEMHSFVVASFDAERRGIQLALIGSPAAASVPLASVAPAKKATTKKAVATKKAVDKAPAKPTKAVASPTSKVAAAKAAPKATPKAASKAKAVARAKPATGAIKTPSVKKAAAAKATATKATVTKATTTKKATAKATSVSTTQVKNAAAPAKGAPTKVTPAKTSPAKAAIKATPVKATPVKATPVKATPVKATPVKATPVKVTPAKKGPAKAAPKKVAAAKATHVKSAPNNASPAQKAVKAPVSKVPAKRATVAKAVPVKAVKKASAKTAAIQKR